MKHWRSYLLAVLAAAAVSLGPFSGSDVAKLEPVEVLAVSTEADRVILRTDTENEGRGNDLQSALADMRKTASAEIFLETADYLILTPDCIDLLPELTGMLRPVTNVCVSDAELDLGKAAEYFSAHEPECSLQDIRAGMGHIPVLAAEEGRMELVQ